jgi:hypothetical protein
MTSVPLARDFHVAVWTGSELLVWGGQNLGTYLATGGRYNPVTDQWSAIPTTGAPSARAWAVGAWTGTDMIVWSGYDGSANVSTGGRYHLATNSWTPTSTTGAPSARSQATAVWTGSEMIVWAGFAPTRTNTGGRYHFASDSWTPTSTGANVPAARSQHSATWTGTEMVVWGGGSSSTWFDNGGRYSPATNSWLPVATLHAPTARTQHTAVWTGSAVWIWGGANTTDTGSGYALGQTRDDDGDGYSECAGDCNDDNRSVFPNAPDVCDSIDNDCDGLIDNESLPPPAVGGLSLGANGALGWTPVLGTVYDVVKGNLGPMRSGAGDFTVSVLACVGNDLLYPVSSDSEVPAPGAGLYFVVRATGCSRSGTYDEGASSQQGSRDAEIAASGNACQ